MVSKIYFNDFIYIIAQAHSYGWEQELIMLIKFQIESSNVPIT